MAKVKSNPANIYAYCPDCKKTLYFVGYHKEATPKMQCPCCRQSWTVPREWVYGIEQVRGFGTPEDIVKERKAHQDLVNLQFRKSKSHDALGLNGKGQHRNG